MAFFIRLKRAFQSPYPIVASLWLAIIFTERVVVHLVAYDKTSTIPAALRQTSVVCGFFVSWILLLTGLVIDRKRVARVARGLRDMRRELWRAVTATKSLIIAASVVALVVALINGTTRGWSIGEALGHFVDGVRDSLLESFEARRHEVALLVGVAGLYVVSLIFGLFLGRGRKAVGHALYELNLASCLVCANALFYLWLNIVVLSPEVQSRQEALSGLVKDTTVYSLVGIGVLVGTTKIVETTRSVRAKWARWTTAGVVAGAISLMALVALVLDLHYKDAILPTSAEYPSAARAMIASHIMVRDYLLLPPLLAAACLRMFFHIERVNREEDLRRRGQRRTRKPGASGAGSEGI